MADTDTETLPNGTGALSTEEEDERMKQRPADIDADVREMERRKRVEALMSSKLFREELERVLDQQMHEGNDAPLLQRIREMVGGRLHTGSLRGPACVLPINDIRGIEGFGYEKGEKILRCKLAAVYRLVDLFGWTQTGTGGLITARLNTAVEQVLTTPRGLLPHEVTASSLVKVDMQGVVQDQGTTNFPVNMQGFSLQACVHAARPDVRCVLHVRSPAALAVSSMRAGLLPLCPEAALLGQVAISRAPPGILDNEERDKLVRALGPHAKVLMLTSGGALCCGATLEEAFFQARNLTAACDVQLKLASLPVSELCLIDEETRKQMYESSRKPPADASKWRVGGEEFEALMRMLDNAGFRTGYIYRHPLIKNDVPKPKNDVEVPPAVSSLGYLLEEEELYKQGIWKKGQGKTGERTRWLNSPNVYQKVEVLETGTTDPKKITKWVDANNEEWVQEGSPGHSSTPVKIDTLQFVPKNTNPKEFKALQQQIKENRRADKISAGPQSHILEGVTWDEASKMVGEDAANTHTGDHVVLMGAASKGIIQRGYQHNATMYSAPYARNPFDHVTDREIDEYKRVVERKQRAGEYDTDLSESEAISAAQITSPASAPSETEEESRDEHRVLRIETKQAPVRSQPEVVLSDDTVDFLNAERVHADRTKDSRDPNLLPDEEVFLSSAATSPAPDKPVASFRDRDPNLLSDDEVFLDSSVSSSVTPVVVRAQHIVVQQRTVRGNLSEARSLTEVLSANKRSIHDYPRNANFENVLKMYDDRKTPKCKISLNNRLKISDDVTKIDTLDLQTGHASSRSSLCSIPSIEWDGRCKSDYNFRTRSLPRQKVNNTNKLFRTRSHGGFINNFVKDPAPTHYHLPRCRSCGASNNSYAWELSKEREKVNNSLYYSVDNLPQKCIDEKEFNVVQVQETVVPVFKVAKVDSEFVDSQEFNEDNYLGDIGNSFSSENQTVIEKPSPIKVDLDNTIIEDKMTIAEAKVNNGTDNKDVFRAEFVSVEPEIEDLNNNTVDSVEGEYHSFTDEMDFEKAVYESPVKDLVEKDIRDYSVPINFYCEDYKNREDSPKKSPLKRREIPKGNGLEPILEESKSSYDDSNNSGDNNKSVGLDSVIGNVVQDVLTKVASVIELKHEIEPLSEHKMATEMMQTEFLHKKDSDFINGEELEMANDLDSVSINNIVQTAIDVYEEAEELDDNVINSAFEDVLEILSSGTTSRTTVITNPNLSDNKDQRTSLYSTSSGTEVPSFNSTAEFEKIEAISDIIACILNKIDFSSKNNEFFNNIENRIFETHFDIQNNNVPEIIDNSKINITDFSETVSTEAANIEMFSIKQIVEDIEVNVHVNLNESIITEDSESGVTQTHRIIEAIVYYLFDAALFVCARKNKVKKNHNVVTVVDNEDILYTSKSLWSVIETAEIEIKKCTENDNSMSKETEVTSPKEGYEYCLNNSVRMEDEMSYNNVISNDIVPSETFVGNENIVSAVNHNVILNHDEITQNTIQDEEKQAEFYILETSDNIEKKIELDNNSQNDTGESIDFAIKEDISNNMNESIYEDPDNTINEINAEMDNVDTEEISFNAECASGCEHCKTENLKRDADIENFLNETFVLDAKQRDMNTAFVEDDYSRSSSPVHENTAFEGCFESPIKNTTGNFVGDDLSVLYEKDDTLLGSPFVKKAPVISMSQTEHIGGIKYWLSFDESLVDDRPSSHRASKIFDEDKIPSFFSLDVEPGEKDTDFESYKRASILKDRYDNNFTADSFASACASQTDYTTAESALESNYESIDSPQKRLLYDSRIDAKKTQRKYSSWPPFDDTLFYRIISKFRMSESFDPSDLETSKHDNSY